MSRLREREARKQEKDVISNNREEDIFGNMKVSLVEKLLNSKKTELIDSLTLIQDGQSVVLWSKLKIQLGKSRRGSRYRGVSRNGKKWQV